MGSGEWGLGKKVLLVSSKIHIVTMIILKYYDNLTYDDPFLLPPCPPLTDGI